MLMTSMQMACKGIARAVKKAGIANLYGGAEQSNASGDDVKKLDLLSNDIMCAALINSHTCAVLVSEENVRLFPRLHAVPSMSLCCGSRKSPLSCQRSSAATIASPSTPSMAPPTL